MSTTPSISQHTRFVQLDELRLECGETISPVRIAYRTWGTLSPDRDNVVLVCHALTGSADVDQWWRGLLGQGRALDPERDYVVCSNVLGSCYGSTGPTSLRPGSSRPWGPDFPDITIRDMVHAQALFLDALGIRQLQLVIGGSLGGMQALEWAACYPRRVASVAAIATSGRHSAWCIGLSEAQRAAIRADSAFEGGHYSADRPPVQGLAAARMIAMCTYRCSESFGHRFGRRVSRPGAFDVESYLAHHGTKLVHRFDANTYITLTRAMDRHDVARGRGPYEQVLRSIRQPTLVVSIDSDVLYPPREQCELVDSMPRASLAWLRSLHGHDGFLIETRNLTRIIVGARKHLTPIHHRKAS